MLISLGFLYLGDQAKLDQSFAPWVSAKLQDGPALTILSILLPHKKTKKNKKKLNSTWSSEEKPPSSKRFGPKLLTLSGGRATPR